MELDRFEDLRGQLAVAELGRTLPFSPRRIFFVYGVPTREVRGEHAHLQLQQFLVCVQGECSVVLDDGENREELRLDNPRRGLYIPPLIWGTQYKFSKDAVLVVLASAEYAPADYVRDYEEFLRLAGAGRQATA